AAADPAWTAEGHVSDRWLPVSPSGKLDAFEWRVPVTGITRAAPPIEPAATSIAAVTTAPPVAANNDMSEKPAALEGPAPHDQVQDHADSSSPAAPACDGPATRVSPTPPKREAVIPLVHAPDDPGPDATDETTPPPEPHNGGGWRRIFE